VWISVVGETTSWPPPLLSFAVRGAPSPCQGDKTNKDSMKVSAEFATAQLTRARQILSSRKLITSSELGQVVTVAIQGNGNMLNSRPAMIYNTNATTTDRLLAAKALLGTASFMAAIEDADEQGVQDYVNSVLNDAQLSFTVPLTSSQTFQNRDLVTALVEEYSRKATDENPTPGKGVGLNNVKPVKATAIGNAASLLGNWDEDEDATITDGTDSAAAPTAEADPFADSNVDPATVPDAAATPAP